MPSKKKGKKKKAAYRRSDRAARFLKWGTFVLLVVAFGAACVLGLKIIARQLHVNDVVVSGNYYLDSEDILNSMSVHRGESMLELDFETVGGRLRKNPWVKNVVMRKQYPDTLLVRIDEAVPTALLRIKKQLYLLDREGTILEKIEGETVPFLPVLNNINHKDKKGMSEALKLVRALNEKSSFIERESIEIGLESYGLTVNLDGEFIKVGYGKYAEKFERWLELEPEIRKRGVPIKYVDLRFKDSVIIKPLKDGTGEKTS